MTCVFLDVMPLSHHLDDPMFVDALLLFCDKDGNDTAAPAFDGEEKKEDAGSTPTSISQVVYPHEDQRWRTRAVEMTSTTTDRATLEANSMTSIVDKTSTMNEDTPSKAGAHLPASPAQRESTESSSRPASPSPQPQHPRQPGSFTASLAENQSSAANTTAPVTIPTHSSPQSSATSSVAKPAKKKAPKKCTYAGRRRELAFLRKEAVSLESQVDDLRRRRTMLHSYPTPCQQLAQQERYYLVAAADENARLRDAMARNEHEIRRLQAMMQAHETRATSGSAFMPTPMPMQQRPSFQPRMQMHQQHPFNTTSSPEAQTQAPGPFTQMHSSPLNEPFNDSWSTTF